MNSLEKLQINYPIGKKVFVRSNEPEPLVVAEIIDYTTISKSNGPVLVLKDCANEKIFFTLSTDLHFWDPRKEALLRSMTWDQQYMILNRYHYLTEEDVVRKNSKEYQEKIK